MQSFYPARSTIPNDAAQTRSSFQTTPEATSEAIVQTPAATAVSSSLYSRSANWGKGGFAAASASGSSHRGLALEAQIRQPRDLRGVLAVVDRHFFEFDVSHTVAALSRLAGLATGSAAKGEVAGPEDAVTIQSKRLIRNLESSRACLQPNDVVSTAWSLAKLQRNQESLWLDLTAAIEVTASTLSPQQIANAAWSLARIGNYHTPLWHALATEATLKIPRAACAEVSMTLWAFANMGVSSGAPWPELFTAGASQVRARLSEFSPTSIANLAWAFAKSAQSGSGCSGNDLQELYCKLNARAVEVMDRFSGWEVATLSWALVSVQVIDEPVLASLAERACSCSLSVPNASTLAWAYAAAGIGDEPLFRSLGGLLRRRSNEIDTGTVARFAWAYGSLEIQDDDLFALLSSYTRGHISDFAPHDLSGVATGFVRVGFPDGRLFDAIAGEALQRLDTLGPFELANLLWAIAMGISTVGPGTTKALTMADISPEVGRFLGRAEARFLQELAAPCEPEALSTAVTALRKVGRFQAALALHERLVAGGMGTAEAGEALPQRRERYRLQFRGREDGYPKQISYSVLLMEAEHRGDTALAVRLLEGLAGEARSVCAKACFLNAAVIQYIGAGFLDDARRLLAQMAGGRLLNRVSQRLLARLELSESSLEPLPPGQLWSSRCDQMGDIEKQHAKELSLLQGVLSLRNCEPNTVLAEIEEFGLKRQWIKVAGGEKAAVVETVIAARRPTRVLEYGVYVGFTSMRMALHMRPWGGRVVSVEMDPVHACITRNIAVLVGLEEQMRVKLGHSDDAVPLLHEEGARFDMVFMDQRSTRFHSDLATLEELGMLLPGCVVMADNVLKPGAPRWLWRIVKCPCYSTHVVSVREFGSAETEDWMTVTALSPAGSGGRHAPVPPEPPGLAALCARADRMRFRTVARNMGNTRRELEDVNRDFTRELAAMGIRKTRIVVTTHDAKGATSRVVPVLDDGAWKEWIGEDPRLDMSGGKWWTDVSECQAIFDFRGVAGSSGGLGGNV